MIACILFVRWQVLDYRYNVTNRLERGCDTLLLFNSGAKQL